jgi:hypothetical protein
MATTSVASAPRSSLGRLISRSRFGENAQAGLLLPNMGRHRWFSTNSINRLAEILSAR